MKEMSSSGKAVEQSNPVKNDDEAAKVKEEEEMKRKMLSQPVYLFCTYLAACYYDKAREIADKERDNSRNSSSQFSSHLLFSVLSQLTAAEKQYMSLAYIAPKRFLMKDTSLSNQYTHLYNEISRLDEKSAPATSSSSRESSPDLDTLILASQIKNFIKARIAMVDFFERLAASGLKSIVASQMAAAPIPVSASSSSTSLTPSSSSTGVTGKENVENCTIMPLETYFVPSIEEIFELYSPSLTHPLLSPLNKSFTTELKAVMSLLVSLREINRWRFYEALMALDKGRGCLSSWSDMMAASIRVNESFLSTTSKMTFFSSLKSLTSSSIRGSAYDQVEPVLHDWLCKLKAALHSKFSLYFFEILLTQTTLSDMRERCTKLAVDYLTKIQTFQRRMEATAISLVFDATMDQASYKGPGFHHPAKKLSAPLQGLDLFPSPFTCPIVGTAGTCIPQDEVARHWPCVVKIITDYARELEMPDKIVYIYDTRLENTYYLLKIDPQVTMVVIFERSKMEKDPQISGFLLEIASFLRCTKIFASLKPGYK